MLGIEGYRYVPHVEVKASARPSLDSRVALRYSLWFINFPNLDWVKLVEMNLERRLNSEILLAQLAGTAPFPRAEKDTQLRH